MANGSWKVTPSVSARLQKVRSRGTGLEARMEDLLRQVGASFQFQPRLQGRPDFRIRGTNVLIFCDSSFWHGRWKEDFTGKSFSRNRALWTAKLVATKKRDARTNRSLRRSGWSVHRFWDTDITSRPERVKARLRGIVHG